jgi:HAD superfamily hydrolase (TIGR01509 family)
MIKNIIFDFDGVIVDSEILVARAFSKYLQSFNIIFSEKEFSIYAGKKTVQVIDELSEKFKIQDQKNFFDDIMNIANNIYSTDLRPVKGVKNFLENNTRKIFIGSNSIKKRILVGLKKTQLDHFFLDDKIFSFDLVKNPKPHPDIYLEAVNTHNLNKSETIIVEDSPVGVQSGVAAGIKVIGLTAGEHWHESRSTEELIDAKAFCVVDSYDDLMEGISNL